MDDYISREAVQNMAYWHGGKSDACHPYPDGVDAVDVSDIEKIPAADVEPVRHGRWIGTADGYADGELVYDVWECSNCGFDADGAEEKPGWRYCPNCGAKMAWRTNND